jgi:hypothetical protein
MSAPTLSPTTFADFSSTSATKIHKWIDHIGEIRDENENEIQPMKLNFDFGRIR